MKSTIILKNNLQSQVWKKYKFYCNVLNLKKDQKINSQKKEIESDRIE